MSLIMLKLFTLKYH